MHSAKGKEFYKEQEAVHKTAKKVYRKSNMYINTFRKIHHRNNA